MLDEFCHCEDCEKIRELIANDPNHVWTVIPGPVPEELKPEIHETRLKTWRRKFLATLRGGMR